MIDTQTSFLACDAKANALGALCDGGYLCLYTAPKPARADVKVSTQKVCAELDFDSPAFKPAKDGKIESNPMGPDNDAAGGQAAWFRVFTVRGEAVYDGTVGTADADLILKNTNIPPHAIVSDAKISYTEPRGTK